MARRLLLVLTALLILGPLPGCDMKGGAVVSTPPPTVTATPTVYATLLLPPTWTPRPPTPTSTRVIPLTPTLTPGPSPTPTRLPARVRALVVSIQDSHTLDVLIDGQPANRVFTIRLLGVEPPLLSDPWADVAVKWLAKEVGRQIIVLESDAVERDPQGNLLRYVWRERRMVNVTLVQLGLATAAEDVAGLRYSADLLAAQADAQAARRGLWGPPPTATPAAPPVVSLTAITATATITVTQTPTATLSPTLTFTP